MTDRQLCSLLYRDDLDLKHAPRKRLQKELEDCKSKQNQLQRQKAPLVFDEIQDDPATMHPMDDDNGNGKLELDEATPIAKALIDYILEAVRGDTGHWKQSDTVPSWLVLPDDIATSV